MRQRRCHAGLPPRPKFWRNAHAVECAALFHAPPGGSHPHCTIHRRAAAAPPQDPGEQRGEDSTQDIDEVSTDAILKLQQETQQLIVQFQNEKARLINQQKQQQEENARFLAQVEAENKGLRDQLERAEIIQTRFETVVLELKEKIDQVKLKLDYISPDKMTLRQQKQILKSNVFKI